MAATLRGANRERQLVKRKRGNVVPAAPGVVGNTERRTSIRRVGRPNPIHAVSQTGVPGGTSQFSDSGRALLAMRENDGSRRLQPMAAFRPRRIDPHAAFGSVAMADFPAAEAPVAGLTTVRAD